MSNAPDSLLPLPDENAIRQALAYVIDPELGINVVELGLVYEARADRDGIRVALTMTSPACPLGQHIRDEAEGALRQHFPHVPDVAVELVWEPEWDPSMMSESAKAQLGW
ncbi:MAG: metal-sulfur cluster assembly factor [Oligoflexia bacterium]|nr:metal-sulfur cluster assembly factor [Oligoflexia bacterium]